MKLYYKPGACSLHPHIALREAGLPFELVKVDTRAGKTADGADYKAINPKGYVPALGLDDGQVLTEGVAIAQFIADQAPEKKLAPAAGTFARARLQEWLNYVATELHKGGYNPLFNPKAPAEFKQATKEALAGKLAWVDTQLAKTPYLMGDAYTVADGYLFNVLSWSRFVGVDLAPLAHLQAFLERVAARPAVQAALAAEQGK